MKPTCLYIYILILWVLLVWQDRVDCYATWTDRSRVIACHSRDIGNILLDYYHLEKYKWWKGKMVTGQGYGLGIGWCKRLCHRGRRHGLVTLLSLSVSVKDRPLHKTLGKSQTYYPKHILRYGRLKDLLLSCYGFRLFPDRLSWWFLG